MLKVDNSMRIAGQAVWRDPEMPHRFYLMGEPIYRGSENGHPKFALLKYRWDVMFDGARGGGLLLFDFLLSVGTAVVENVRAELKGFLANEEGRGSLEPEISLIPFSKGEVTVSFMEDADVQIRLPVNSHDNYAASVVLPLSVKSVTLLEEALKKNKSIFSLAYKLKAHGQQNGDVAAATFSHSAILPPLVTLRDVTGALLDVGQFISPVALQTSRYFHPLLVKVRLVPELKDCGVDRVIVYLEPEGGQPMNHEFTPAHTQHLFASHNDSRRYEYWCEIYLHNGQIVESSRETTENSVLLIDLRQILP